MTEQNDGAAQRQPAEPQPTPPVGPPPAAPPVVEEPRPRLRDLTFRIRSMAAVAAVALVVGVGVGAAIGVAASGDGHSDGPDRTGFGRPPGGPSFNQAPNGQLPPGTTPQQQDDSQG
jgi:hypothetical protein